MKRRVLKTAPPAPAPPSPAPGSAPPLIALQAFASPTWDAWREVLARVTDATRELWCVCGRGAGKSRVAAWLAALRAVRTYPRVAGELIYVGVFAPTRDQATITWRYVAGLFRSDPNLERMSVDERDGRLELANGVCIEVVTASTSAPRGRTYACAIVEEAAFLPQETSANPDSELLRSIRPGLARCPGSLLVVLSSPYARRGELWKAHQRWEGTGGDAAHVYVRAPTLAMNPTFDPAEVQRAREEDPQSAAAEYDAEFRSDVESFLSFEVVHAATVPGRAEVPPAGLTYSAFVDPAGGSGGDSMTLAISHADRETGKRVLDLVREVRPPFSPERCVEEFVSVLQSYGISVVVGDNYGGDWPKEHFTKRGVHYVRSERSKSQLYLEALALLNSGRAELLDVPRLKSQLLALERRTARGGRDSVDHPPRQHDDLANAAAGSLVEVAVRGGTFLGAFDYFTGAIITGVDEHGTEWRDCEVWDGWARRPRLEFGDPGLLIKGGLTWRGVQGVTGHRYADGRQLRADERAPWEKDKEEVR